MQKKAYLLVLAALVLPVGGVVLDRSMAASATRIAAPADTRMVRADFMSARPVDADYAVPGVLDDRSWKPEYDRMPATHVASYVHHRPVAVQQVGTMPASFADQAAQPIAVPVLPPDKAPVTLADDSAVSASQVQP